jgi:hypothetical protein
MNAPRAIDTAVAIVERLLANARAEYNDAKFSQGPMAERARARRLVKRYERELRELKTHQRGLNH